MNLILVGYTKSKTLAAIKFCEKTFSRSSFDHRILVCNRENLVEMQDVPGWTLLAGSNRFAEFSGWQEGLNHLLSMDVKGPVIFANDTVNSHRRFSVFRRWALVRQLRSAPPRSIVGFVDHGNNDIGDLTIAGLVLPGWVSTYCFLLGTETLARLQHKLYVPEVVEGCVPGGASENEFLTTDLSPDLQRQLRDWLFKGGWYRSEPLGPTNLAMFTLKARVICAEWHLSARCWHIGCSRHDPFERHPFMCNLDGRAERLMKRLGILGSNPAA